LGFTLQWIRWFHFRILRPEIGEEHWYCHPGKNILQRYKELQDIIAILDG
jgi:F0F1-type ATP synthase beta subunit